MDFAVAGQWGVDMETITYNNLAWWYNPGGGFGIGCTAWGMCPAGDRVDTGDPAFAISGPTIPAELQSFSVE